jgi:hypothetical protein
MEGLQHGPALNIPQRNCRITRPSQDLERRKNKKNQGCGSAGFHDFVDPDPGAETEVTTTGIPGTGTCFLVHLFKF